MSRTRLILVAVLALLGGAFVLERTVHLDFERSAKAAPEASQAAAAGSSTPSAGRQSAAGVAPIAVVTAVANSEDVPVTVRSVGWVEPIASVAVQPRLDGVLVAQLVTEGQTVHAGEVLFRLDDAALQAVVARDQANVAKDQANLDQANADLKRDQSLAAFKNAVTAQAVQQQQALVKADEATVAVDNAQLKGDQVQLGYATITAPIGGRIGAVNFTLGALVTTAGQTPLLTVTQMAPLRVSYAVPERYLGSLRQALAASPPAAVKVFDPETSKLLATGTLSFVDSSISTSSGTVTVKANFENGDGVLWPGQYLQVETELGVDRGATVVPLAALQVNDKGTYVFLVKPDGTVATQTVTVVSETGDTALIGSGVNPRDHVVVEGQLRLRDGSRVKETLAANAAASEASGQAVQ